MSTGHINNQVDQGEARAMAWHAIGHGADAIRTGSGAPYNGQEQYHGSLVDQSTARPFYAEAAGLGARSQGIELLAAQKSKPGSRS
jgi:beta-galactosidase